MSQNQIKWLAAILMLVDHVGVLIEIEPLRIIGRLSFPLFAWVFAQNWQRSNDKKALTMRLLLFGVLSQIPYTLLFGNLQLNIMFSFATVAITFYCIRKFNRKIATLGAGLFGAQILQVNYGWYAITCTLLMIDFKNKRNRLWLCGWLIVNIAYTISSQNWIQIFAILAPLILTYYDERKDKKPSALEKRFFYYLYPLHMAVLAASRAIT
jgi:positive regulator of sigma E activity